MHGNISRFSVIFTDKQAEHRRVQGLLQGRPAEDRLAAHGGTEEALPDTLGHDSRIAATSSKGLTAFPARPRLDGTEERPPAGRRSADIARSSRSNVVTSSSSSSRDVVMTSIDRPAPIVRHTLAPTSLRSAARSLPSSLETRENLCLSPTDAPSSQPSSGMHTR